uniref:Suppressor of forked domain-containing protein n=1 Tax=Ananas comosus var. bracteatus TaxID=296719 RepID=A0A6V7PDS8_ANACO|nr:unnamed protein product [Ananas comosus var. bracteatus]
MAEELKGGSGGTTDIYNVEAAEILANEALLLPISEAAPIYEKLLSTFPTAAKYWKQYVEAYMAVNNDEATKQIFSRRCYIRFIRKVNEKKGTDGLEETKKAFDFLLSYVGSDIASGPIWMEYITFLKSMPATTVQIESQRMTSVRKLWKEYESFENSVSRALAKGLLSEYQSKFNSAKAVYRERKKYIDDIDWNMLAIPPTGSSKEEQQCMAWKRLIAFEKGNPQRIDATSANRRVTFTYEQCLMYLYHYPDIWYDYATWHAKTGSVDSAVKVFQRALKALPDSELLRYAYAELEESRGAIQFIRFLRRTEGIEAAKKYFLDARKSPSCTYHVFVAYATMAFCLDKDAKMAHSVFEAGLNKFMHEPGYILEYADFLCRLNDDRNVWKRFTQFEQTYGDLSSMLKVEQRRKEALSRTAEDGSSVLENTLYDVVSRYSFMDLWPCSSKDLDHLAQQEWLAKNMNKVDKPTLQNGSSALGSEKAPVGLATNNKVSPPSTKVVLPDTSRMLVYDPRQTKGPEFSAPSSVNSSTSTLALLGAGTGTTQGIDEILKVLSPPLVAFITQLPAVKGPSPDLDVVLSILLQSSIPVGNIGKPASSSQQVSTGPVPSTSDISGSSWSRLNQNGSANRLRRDGQLGKRKDLERQEEDDTTTVQSRPLPQDVFRLRQIRKSRGVSNPQTGSAASGGSAFSGEQSISTD